MMEYRITVTGTTTVIEHWRVKANSPEEAREKFDRDEGYFEDETTVGKVDTENIEVEEW